MSQSPSKPRLSLCMIVKNEEHFLQSFLDSHAGFFDDWVIVDTGSTDATPQIIEKAGIPQHTFTWCDDFAVARNYALSLCQGEWVGAFDADEFLDAEGQQQMRHFIGRPEIDAYDFDIKNYINEEVFLDNSPEDIVDYVPPDGSYASATQRYQASPGDKDYGYRTTRLVRFFRRCSGYRWVSPIHEVLTRDNSEGQGKEGYIQGVAIHHLGMLDLDGKAQHKREFYGRLASELRHHDHGEHSPKTLFEAARSTTDPHEKLSLLLQVLENTPRDVNVLKEVIKTQITIKDWPAAITASQRLKDQHPELLESHLTLARCYASKGDHPQAIAILREQFRIFRHNALYNHTLATLCIQTHDVREARSYAQRAYRLSPHSPMIAKLHQALCKS